MTEKRTHSRITVAVVYGGTNSEKEISLVTGERVLGVLNELGYRTFPYKYDGDLDKLVAAVDHCALVFNALHGGEGEDGTVQAAFEAAGMAYTGSGSAASRLAMDKLASKARMVSIGVPTAPWVGLLVPGPPSQPGKGDYPELERFCREHTYPLVVKPNHEGSTVGLSIVESDKALEQALVAAASFGPQVLVEAYIPGRELTVTILEGQPLPIVEIVPQHAYYDYESKYENGMSEYFVPADVAAETGKSIQAAALKLHEALDCRHYSRADFRLDQDNGYFCLEINTLPGMTTHSLTPMAAAAVGLDFNGLIDKIVKLSLL